MIASFAALALVTYVLASPLRPNSATNNTSDNLHSRPVRRGHGWTHSTETEFHYFPYAWTGDFVDAGYATCGARRYQPDELIDQLRIAGSKNSPSNPIITVPGETEWYDPWARTIRSPWKRWHFQFQLPGRHAIVLIFVANEDGNDDFLSHRVSYGPDQVFYVDDGPDQKWILCAWQEDKPPARRAIASPGDEKTSSQLVRRYNFEYSPSAKKVFPGYLQCGPDKIQRHALEDATSQHPNMIFRIDVGVGPAGTSVETWEIYFQYRKSHIIRMEFKLTTVTHDGSQTYTYANAYWIGLGPADIYQACVAHEK